MIKQKQIKKRVLYGLAATGTFAGPVMLGYAINGITYHKWVALIILGSLVCVQCRITEMAQSLGDVYALRTGGIEAAAYAAIFIFLRLQYFTGQLLLTIGIPLLAGGIIVWAFWYLRTNPLQRIEVWKS